MNEKRDHPGKLSRSPRRNLRLLWPLCALLVLACLASAQTPTAVRFAVIGDYGSQGVPELDVSNLVQSWNPDLIITAGDNNYPDGEASTIDGNIGLYYHNFIDPYLGNFGGGADTNRFFPSLGNHDWRTTGAQPYLDYFTLPGNERYYDFVWGPVHFFAIDSDSHEPDGNDSTSVQAAWLEGALAASSAPYKLVYFHHPPYSSSSNHGSTANMQWPFKRWGATAVLAGHDHIYERLIVDGLPYFVNGLGGRSIYGIGTPLPGSQVRYNGNYGAMLVIADADSINFRFFTRSGALVDSYTINNPLTGIAGGPAQGPADFHLEQNFPNPFNPSTRIRFTLSAAAQIRLSVYNLLGQEVGRPAEGPRAAGAYEVNWDAGSLPAGVYIYRLRVVPLGAAAVAGRDLLRKMVLLK